MYLTVNYYSHTPDEKPTVFSPGLVSLFIFEFWVGFQKPIVPGLHIATDCNFIVPMSLFFSLFFGGVHLSNTHNGHNKK
jgi:hypothetical protein